MVQGGSATVRKTLLLAYVVPTSVAELLSQYLLAQIALSFILQCNKFNSCFFL
jgi:hypothetical protein